MPKPWPLDPVPAFILGQLALALRQIDAARWRKAQVFLACAARQIPPDPVRLHYDRELRLVAALLTHPTPVTTRLLARNPTLLAEQYFRALFRQEPGRGRSDDTGSDDDDVDGFRQWV
jgi:hypothetical protein